MHSTMYYVFSVSLKCFMLGFASACNVTIFTINNMNLLISKDEPIFKH